MVIPMLHPAALPQLEGFACLVYEKSTGSQIMTNKLTVSVLIESLKILKCKRCIKVITETKELIKSRNSTVDNRLLNRRLEKR